MVIAESIGQRQAISDDLIKVDVRKKYTPKKELILQDFMDVEYVALETNDDFLNQGIVQDVGGEFILVRNRINDGDIFIYNRKGKALKKINRRGQGPEEYTNISKVFLDEENAEIFVNDYHIKKVIVYDLNGKFKRSFRHQEVATYNQMYNFDKDNFICHDMYTQYITLMNEERTVPTILIVSKKDGSITKGISIPFKQAKEPMILIFGSSNNITNHADIPWEPIVHYRGNWILVEPSADTLYSYMSDHTMTPFIVRTPSIQSMNPEVFLFPFILTDRYFFLQSVKKEYNFETRSGFPTTNLMYDRQEKTIHDYTVYNGDFSIKSPMYLNRRTFINDEVVFVYKYEAHFLLESLENGQLKGKLKEVAAKLDAENNPVLMLVKHKNSSKLAATN